MTLDKGKTLLSLLSWIMSAALLFIILVGCSPAPAPAPSNNEPKPSIAEYYPMAVGNLWKYEGIGNEYASYTQEVTYQSGNKFQLIVNNGGTVTANRYEVAEDTILHTFREHHVYDNKNLLSAAPNLEAVILKLPLEVGTSWISDGNSCEITDINATVQVPAGVFQGCIAVKVTYKDSGNSSFFYYKKGIGLVKSEYVMPGHDSIISQLMQYTLK